jgi:transcriptional regulator GlxA family with amidase domain
MQYHEVKRGPRWVPAIREYIDAHVHEPIKVSQLAALVNVHPVYFARAFKSSCGMSVLRYVRQRRVVAASATMMSSSPVRLVDLANQFGFADQAHFSRVFREEFGASPSKFRAKGAGSATMVA